MPPKKEAKEKALKPDEAEDCVLQYMKGVRLGNTSHVTLDELISKENRPYSSSESPRRITADSQADVAMNLKGKVPKAAAQKIMAALAEKGSLTVKAYGKQTIFVYNQSQLDVASGEELAGLDEQLKEIKDELEQRKKEYRTMSSELAAMVALPKTKDLQVEINRVKNENDLTINALLPYRGDDSGNCQVQPMSVDDIKNIDVDFAKWRKQWVDRRKVYKELLGMLTEAGQVQDVSQFEDDQGINPDEDDAKELESGEFCKPPAAVKKLPPRKGVSASSSTPKRPPSSAPSSTREDSQPKKKTKKVKG